MTGKPDTTKIKLEFTEREVALLEMLSRKGFNEFLHLYKVSSKKKEDEMTDEQTKRFEFFRNSTLILEKIMGQFQKALKKEGCIEYNFDAMLTKEGMSNDTPDSKNS